MEFSLFHILSVSYHFPQTVNGEETQETKGHDTVAQHELNLKACLWGFRGGNRI